MDIVVNKLTGATQASLFNEIMYFVASANSLGKTLIKLTLDEYSEDKLPTKITTVERVLKGMKRDGRIQLYIYSANLGGESTESQYLYNKYPSISNFASEGSFYIVKLEQK